MSMKRKQNTNGIALSKQFKNAFQERLGVLAATCAARKRLPLRTSAIRRRLLFFIVRLYSR